MDTDRIYKALYLFSGIGCGALGFQQVREEFKGRIGRFETLAGIAVDAQVTIRYIFSLHYTTEVRAEQTLSDGWRQRGLADRSRSFV